jgi:hypothetical protein
LFYYDKIKIKRIKMNQLKLKTRLKFIRNNSKIDNMINNNFGYCPSSNDFENLLKAQEELMIIAEKNFPDLYNFFLDYDIEGDSEEENNLAHKITSKINKRLKKEITFSQAIDFSKKILKKIKSKKRQ